MKIEDAKNISRPDEELDARIVSIFNPTAFELKRVAILVDKIVMNQERCTNIANLKAKDALSWLGSLRALYTIMKPLLYDNAREEIEQKIEEIMKEIYDKDTYSDTNKLLKLYSDLSELTDIIMDYRQTIGLGLYVGEEKEVSERDLKERLI